MKKLPPLIIGDLLAKVPIIQGGMGVRVSKSELASAVANQNGIGVIASVCLGKFEDYPKADFVQVNEQALRYEMQRARTLSPVGVIGVNVMVALANYENLVTTAIEGADLLIVGAGLPLDLPQLTYGSSIKLVPIVSSARAFKIICQRWWKHYQRLPDAVVVEGPLAGGHLGFKRGEIEKHTLDKILIEVINVANTLAPSVPVIAAGGIFDGKDIAHAIKLGASGVQMATRFVCTHECDVHENFKRAFLRAAVDGITIIDSPVGLPGRVIKNEFVERVLRGETKPVKCEFRCLKTCNPATAPYCIAKVLANAADGNLDEAFVFAGSNVTRCREIVSVSELMSSLVAEAEFYLNK